MTIVHLTASTFFGGPERQMLGLAESMSDAHRSAFVLFPEGGRYRPLLDEAHRRGFQAEALDHDTPRLDRVAAELPGKLRALGAEAVCCHGYKADLLGWWSARRLGIPAVAVSRGWTWESFKVRCYEALDRWQLRWMDRVVCVSAGQAAKVRRAGVPADRIAVIRNSVRCERFEKPDPSCRTMLQGLFPTPRRCIVGAAGRLSPEKGFANLIDAAAEIVRTDDTVGFVLFGDGPLRAELEQRIRTTGLQDVFILAGFRDDLDRLVPFLDLSVLPSYTEGLPNVVLEALAAAVPVVATAVGGTPEVVEDGVNGYLVPAGDVSTLTERIRHLLSNDALRRTLGTQGRRRVEEQFTFEAQARQYEQLFAELRAATHAKLSRTVADFSMPAGSRER